MPRSTEERSPRGAAESPPPHAELLARLLEGIERELPRAVELRHRLHSQPQLAGAGGRGGLARIGPADGPAVAVRAELDGLPIEERTGASFSAVGEAMHACG